MRVTVSSFPTSGAGTINGVQEVKKVASPAAGADWTYTVPGGYWQRLLGGSARLVTSAVVATRQAWIQYTDGTNVLTASSTTGGMTAGATWKLFISGGPVAGNGVATANFELLALPGIWLQPGYTIGTVTNLIDVGDQWSSIVLWVESWDYGSYGQPVGEHTVTEGDVEADWELAGGSRGQLQELASIERLR